MADLDQSPPPTLANSASCAPAMPMAAPEQLVPKVLPPQTFYAPELEEVHTLVTSIVCSPEIRVEKVEITVPETKTLADCSSVPATRVAAELAIPDASTPTPAPDGLHPILAKALGKDSGFTPTVYLKNGNQYWVKIRTSDGQVLHIKIRYSLGKSKLQIQLQKSEDDELVAF